MPYIAGYLLKLSVSLSVVYIFYTLVLRRLTFYTWNRWYLLGYSILAFLIPFVNISPVLENNDLDKNAVLQLIPVFANLGPGHSEIVNKGLNGWMVLQLGAIAGILLMVARFLLRYISFRRIRRSAQLMVDGGVKVYHVDKSIIPFSFGNAIFINPQLHSEEDLQQIIHHEFIHVKQKHTIDILWSELLCVLNWYNPFAWLIRKAIRQNLEFIADHKVLENGIDKKHYQYLLLKVTGAAHFSITQQFNFSSLKKRIVMMNRSRSATIQLTRFLFLLPLLTVLLLAFRQNVNRKKAVPDTTTSKDDVRTYVALKLKQILDTIPAKGAKKAVWQENFLAKNPAIKNIGFENTPDAAGKLATVVITRRDGIVEKYDWNDLQARAQFQLRYKGSLPEVPVMKETKPDEKVILDAEVTDASVDGPGNPNLRPPANNLLIVIDGVPQNDGSIAKLEAIKPEHIDKINILKGESAIKAYGDKAKGKDGVIEVITTNSLNGVRIKGNNFTIISDSVVLNGNPQVIITGRTGFSHALYIVDGVEYSAAEFEKLNIDPSNIESISVIKDGPAIKKYGEKAKYGVIVVTLKKPVTYKNESPGNGNAENGLSSDIPVWTVDGYTYAVAGAGSTATVHGIVNTVIVDDKLYTVDEAKKLFKRSEFSGVGILDAKTVLKVHGRNEPAVILTRKGSDDTRYRLP